MHNPLALFTTEVLNALTAQGFTIFVRQSYPRGKDHSDTITKEAFLITPYRDIGVANQHFQYIRFDTRKYIYQVHNPDELEKLKLAATQPSGYKVFVDKLAAEEWHPTKQIMAKISSYLRVHTKWKPRENGIRVNLFLHFGELMLRLTCGNEEIKIALREIEGI